MPAITLRWRNGTPFGAAVVPEECSSTATSSVFGTRHDVGGEPGSAASRARPRSSISSNEITTSAG